jgi:hypothetical protein
LLDAPKRNRHLRKVTTVIHPETAELACGWGEQVKVDRWQPDSPAAHRIDKVSADGRIVLQHDINESLNILPAYWL